MFVDSKCALFFFSFYMGIGLCGGKGGWVSRGCLCFCCVEFLLLLLLLLILFLLPFFPGDVQVGVYFV